MPLEIPPDTSEEVAELYKRVHALEEADSLTQERLEGHDSRLRNLEKAQNQFVKLEAHKKLDQKVTSLQSVLEDTNYELDKVKQDLEALAKKFDNIDAPTRIEFQTLHMRVDKLEKMIDSLL